MKKIGREFSTYLRGATLLKIMKKNIRRLKMTIDCRTIKTKQRKIYIESNETVAMRYSTQKSTQKNSRLEKAVWGSVAW